MSTLYEPLDRQSYELRLLSFVANSSGELTCTLRTHSLVFNPPKYVALSYCWGDETIRSNMIVNGQVVSVTSNLKEALRGVRARAGEDVIVWADAICINQKDKQELSLQVGMMKQIYEKADMVYAWLGGHNFEQTQLDFQTAKALVDMYMPVAASESALTAASDGLCSILSCPLWQRRWIVQELTAANQVELLCNNAHISWLDLDMAYRKCANTKHWLQQHDTAAMAYVQILVFREEYWQGTLPKLCDAIFATRNHLSKDPRDRIYAVLGVTSDGPALVPTPNYLQDTGQISRELTRAVLNRNANLDLILADSRTRVAGGSLPTWSPDWCSASLKSIVGQIAGAESRHPRGFVTARVPGIEAALRVQGVSVGMISALTTPLDGQPLRARTADSIITPLSDRSCKQYYRSRSGIAHALTTSLLNSDTDMLIWPISKLKQWTRMSDAGSQILLWVCATAPQIVPFLNIENRRRLFDFAQWLQRNTEFSLDKMSICCSLQPFYLNKTFAVLMTLFILTDLAYLFELVKIPIWVHTAVSLRYFIMSAVMLGTILLLPNLVLLRSLLRGASTVRRICRRANSQRIFILDQGAIGFVCNDSRRGDRICLLAGCTRAVVLRPHTINGHSSYMVVGDAFVCLNEKDRRKYEVLLDSDIGTGEGSTSRPELATAEGILRWYKAQDWWESFDLI